MDGWIRSFMRAGTTLNWSWWLNQLKYIIEMDITWIQTWQLLIVLGRQLHWIIWLWQFLMLKLKCFEFSGSIICDKWCKTKYFQWNLHSSLTKWIPVCKYPDNGPPSPSPCQTQHVYPIGLTSRVWLSDIIWQLGCCHDDLRVLIRMPVMNSIQYVLDEFFM